MAAPPLPKPKKRNKKRNPSELVVASIVKMPLGELSRLAVLLYERDSDSAEFLTLKLASEQLAKSSRDALGGPVDPEYAEA